MGETPRRSGFRLPWGESSDASSAKPEQAEAASETAAQADATAQPDAPLTPATAAEATPATAPESTESSQFLRELVDAMRGVAESSRDSNLAELRTSLDRRVDEMRATAAARAEDLRQRSEQDIAGVGDWERTEIERIKMEAEQRRDSRRAKLERELTDHQASSDREVEATRRKLSDYERELGTFFAELAEIQDPAAFVAAAKRMPPPPDLGVAAGSDSSAGSAGNATAPGLGESGSASASGSAAAVDGSSTTDDTLAQRLAQLDQRLAEAQDKPEVAATTDAEVPAPAPAQAEAVVSAAPPTATPVTEAAQPETATDAVAGETSTPIVVKGLGSFGAITSFKQALERVDGVRGVTLSLGPTGEFVYRASHGAEFDIIGAIRTIEGQGAGIEESEGSVLVTIERQR